MSRSRFAILLDGAFVIKKLQSRLHHFPTAGDIEQLCHAIRRLEELRRRELLRIYFYHAPPADRILINPINKSKLDLRLSTIHAQHASLLETLELCPNFAIRLGETVTREWRLGSQAIKSLSNGARIIEPQDLVPNISQKGVDLRIGLDIARLSLQRMVEAIVIVTGDSDLVPAFRFARREGLRVYLDYLNHGITRELKAHCDMTLSSTLEAASQPSSRASVGGLRANR